MTKLQSVLVGAGLVLVGIGLSIYGWCAHTPEAVTLGALCFGSGLGALGIPRPTDV
jgi:hypothetical protein